DLARYDQHTAQRHRLLAELRQAVGRNQLVLHYQPKLDLTMGWGRVTGVEALLRWEHPEQGLLGPDQFIGLVEQHGLIGPVTQWVVEAALRQVRAWQQIGLPLEVAVNVSMRSLAD